MSSRENVGSWKEHGTENPDKRGRIECNYCGKEVSKVQRLKFHLAGVGPGVVKCQLVPDAVRAHFKNEMQEWTKQQALKAMKEKTTEAEASASKAEECDDDHQKNKRNKIAPPVSNASYLKRDRNAEPVLVSSTNLEQVFQKFCEYGESLKNSWSGTGCSILLDIWKDGSGKSLMICLVQCRLGTLFLRSMDLSGTINVAGDLAEVLDKVLEEVGGKNVVQVITNVESPHMKAAQMKLNEKHPTVFWTLCADLCIDRILEKITQVDDCVQVVLRGAKLLTSFLDSSAHGPLDLKSGFAMLSYLVSEHANLYQIFQSDDWKGSILASTARGREMAHLVTRDPCFWTAAEDIVKLADPFLDILDKLETEICPMAVLYDAFGVAKQKVCRNLGMEPVDVWRSIDEIVWDSYLSPLHRAGYFFNPRVFYSRRIGDKVRCATNATLLQMARGETNEADMLLRQTLAYTEPSGSFADCAAVAERMSVPQAKWWSYHGESSPELRQAVVRILSQPCRGAAKYNWDKSITEQLHSARRSCSEQKALRDMEFVHYNRLLLQRSVPSVKARWLS